MINIQFQKNPLTHNLYESVVCISSLLLAIGLLLNTSFAPPIGLYDEGFALTNAWRLMNNETPHLDYWAAYPPGTSATLAFMFSLFEPNLFVARIVNFGWSMVLLVATYVTISRVQANSIAAIAAFFVSWLYSTSFFPSTSSSSALALCFTVGALITLASSKKHEKLLWLAGLIGGITIIFRHDFAFYMLCASSVALFLDFYFSGPANLKKSNTLRCLQTGAIFLLIYITVALILLSLLIYWGHFENVYDQMILFPATGMRDNRLLPVPSFLDLFEEPKRWLLAWSVPISLFAGIVISVFTGAWQKSDRRRILIFSGMMGLMLILQSRNRLDITHTAPSVLFVIIFICAACRVDTSTISYRLAKVASLVLMIGVAYLSLYSWTSSPLVSLSCSIPTAEANCMAIRADQNNIVNYLKRNTELKEYVFVGNTRHDEIFINDASLYFLIQRPIPIPWNEMHPGVVTTSKVQDEIVRQLKNKNVQYIVSVEMGRSKEPNMSAVSSGVFILDDFIRKNYLPVFSSGNYTVNKRLY